MSNFIKKQLRRAKKTANRAPLWRATFKDLPKIPKSKKWTIGKKTNPEQRITYKLNSNQQITKEEKEQLQEAIKFYDELFEKLRILDIGSLNLKERKELIRYLNYAFTFTLLIQNNVTVWRIYRVVINRNIVGRNERIFETKYITYPPLSIVRKNGKFNRANSPDFNLFYATDSINTALLELKPDIGDIVTISEWIPIEKEVVLVSYPITFNPLAIQVNAEAKKGYLYYKRKVTPNIAPIYNEWLEKIFSFICNEFAKTVNSHYEYFYSSYFSKKILDTKDENWAYDCILYPSVGNSLEVDNLAIRPSVVDEKFKLNKVTELKVTETQYEIKFDRKDPEKIDVILFENKVESTEFNAGQIIWNE